PPLDHLRALTSLELGPNPPLRRPPDWLWRMTWLTRLSLFRFPLASIPHDLSRLHKLTWLEIGEPGDLLEHDRSVPTALFSLDKLEMLSIFGSSMTALPPEIARLAALRELSLIETRLTSLPSAIGSLSKLET